MKKFLLTLVIFIIFTTNISQADSNRLSKEYLQNNKHFSVMNPFVESLAELFIKSALKKETGANYTVEYEGYTFESMRKGIFKKLYISGENVNVNDILVPFVRVESLTDYNYIDFNSKPVKYLSDMEFAYELQLAEGSINSALKHDDYKKVVEKISKIAYPMFEVYGVTTRIVDNKFYVLTEYNFPIAPSKKNKVFVAACDFKVENGKILANNIEINTAYGNLSLNKVANMINFLNPLQFTLDLLEKKNCNANIENVNIIDNKVKINGKIFIKGD